MTFLVPASIDTVPGSEKGITVEIISLIDGSVARVSPDAPPITISIYGPDSARAREVEREIQKERLRVAQAGGEMDDDEIMARRLAGVTYAWTGIMSAQGVEAPCTFENAMALYGHKNMVVLRDQVANRFAMRRNFITASSGA